MSSAFARTRILQIAPRLQARLAGMLYLVAVVTAVIAEFVIPGRMGSAAVVIPIACYATVTLLLFSIFKVAARRLCLLAALCGLTGLAFEALRWQPDRVNLGMTFHGLFCILIGYLMFRSRLIPRGLGGSMALAGVVWLAYIFPSLADRLAPYNSAAGLLAEAIPMLWLLAAGVNEHQWRRISGHVEVSP